VLISGDARLVAVRGADGGLAFSTAGRPNTSSLTRETWLRRDGLDSAAVWPTSGESADGRLACDPRGCVYIARAHVVAIARRAEALADDCRYATVLIATFNLRRPCTGPALAIDRAALLRDGGHALWLDRNGGGAVAASVRSSRGERPWVPRPPAPPARPQPATAPAAEPQAAAPRVPPRPVADEDPADD
jgi:competence protein ComEC